MLILRNIINKLISYRVEEMLSSLLEQNMRIPIKKIKDFVYEIQLQNFQQPDKPTVRILKLGLSGSSLVVRQGGGYYDFLEYLDRKGFLSKDT